MGTVHEGVTTWLKRQPDWVVQAFAVCRAGTDSQRLAEMILEDRCAAHGIGSDGRLVEPAAGAESDLATSAVALASTLPDSEAEANGAATAPPDELRQIIAVDHVAGVNRLRPGDELTFGQGLTVLYGANGAGKSGYVRILETACGSPHAEGLLPDVFETDPPPPGATLKLLLTDGREAIVPFNGGALPIMEAVESFNLRYRDHVLRQRDEVTALHGGLGTILALKPAFEAAKQALAQHPASRQVVHEFDELAGPHAVGSMIEGLGADSKIVDFQDMASLTVEEGQRAEELRARRAGDKAREDRTRHLRSVAEALRTHVGELAALAGQLTVDHIQSLEGAARALVDARSAARQLAAALDEHAALDGVGTSAWRKLWESAAEFSHAHAYPDEPFPALGDDARCVLCMQPLAGEQGAVDRMEAFSAYMKEVRNSLLSEAEQSWNRHLDTLRREMPPLPRLISEEFEANHEAQYLQLKALREHLDSAISVLVQWVDETDGLLVEGTDNEEIELLPWGPVALGGEPGLAVLSSLDALVTSIETSADNLEGGLTEEESAELAALEARHALERRLGDVEAAIEQHQIQTKVGKVERDLGSNRLTAGFNELVEVVLDEPQGARFRRELDGLNLGHLQVARPIRAEKAVAWTQTALDGAHARAQVTQVISTGEQNGVAVAAFLSQLNDDGQTPVVLDDPVSAMDDRARDRVAERLVQLSKSRQVIVFTHDPFFCTKLLKQARWQGVDHSAARLFRVGATAGLVDRDGPFFKGGVDGRIQSLRAQADDIVEAYEKGEANAPDRAAQWMSNLRAAWESTVEDLIFGGVVRRYQAEVNVTGLSKIRQVEPALAELAASEYRRCHPDIMGHDDGLGAGESPIQPSEVSERMEAIERFVALVKSP